MKNVKVADAGSSLSRFKHSVDPDSPIGKKWAALGGQAVVGNAVSEVLPFDDTCQFQMFVLGAIFWSPAFGAVYMSERIWRKWTSPSVESAITSTGENVQKYLGCPTDDTLHVYHADAVREWLYFERGMIYAGAEGSFAVYGDIYGAYRANFDGLTGMLGAPISDVRSAPGGGHVSHFVNGEIYYHNRTGAHEVHGAIRYRYEDLGGPGSPLGYPVSDEEGIRGHGQEIGRFNRFENGSGIYWSNTTGAWEVYGAIFSKWMESGGATGKLGFPTSGEADTPASGGRFNEFQHGVVVWHGAGPYGGAYAVTDLELVIQEFNVNDDFNVQVNITATTSAVNHGRMPADGEYDGGSETFNPPVSMVSIDVVRANSAITVWLNAIHEVLIGKDDRMGTITANYSIDNVWGLLETDYKHHAGSFDAWFRVRPKTLIHTTDPHELFWPFSNTSTGKLSWETYARTYRDVKETDKHINLNPFDASVHPWEIFFYEAVYNSLAEGGSCFGTCLEAVYAREERSLFLEPVRSNAFNPYVRNHPTGSPATNLMPANAGDGVTLDEINVKHGYEMGFDFIAWFLGQWTAGNLHDPEHAYRMSYQQYQNGDWPLLTISDEDKFSQDSAHVVMPYEWDPVPDKMWTALPTQPLKIHVKNPNFPLSPHGDSHCVIEIDHLTWQFKFLFADGETWRGSAVRGGRLLSIPFSELNSRPVTPGYAVLALLAAGVILIMGGDGQTEQITDNYGRTFFHYEQSLLVPIGMKEINWNKQTRIPNMMQIPMFGSARASGRGPEPEYYYYRAGPPPAPGGGDTGAFTKTGSMAGKASPPVQDNLHYQIRGQANGMVRWTVIAPRMSATVIASTETGVLDSIRLSGPGGHYQNVTVQFPNATRARNVSVIIGGWRGDNRQHARSFVLEELSMDKTDSIRAQLTDGGKQLIVENAGAAKTFNLRLLVGLPAQEVAVRNNLAIDAASAIRLNPTDWSLTALPSAPIRLDVLDKTLAKVVKSVNV